MKNAIDLFNEFISKKNLRMTPQRSLILDIFLKKQGHLSAEQLYDLVKKKDPTIGQATVYRMLRLLSESGIAREVDFGDGVSRFEADVGKGHHDHLICTECNKEVEVVDTEIEKLQERLAKKHGFLLTGHKMYLYGLCSSCRKKRKSRKD